MAALLLASCASPAPRPEGCDAEYAYTIMECAKPKTRRPTNPQECTEAGGIQIWKDGDYRGCADRDSVWRIMRGQVQ